MDVLAAQDTRRVRTIYRVDGGFSYGEILLPERRALRRLRMMLTITREIAI